MKKILNLQSFKKKREQQLMNNRTGKGIFTSFNSRMEDFYTH